MAFKTIHTKVTAQQLCDAAILSQEDATKLEQGSVTVEQLSKRHDLKRYLQGESSIAGLLIHSTHEKLSIYQAMKKRLLRGGTALMLLEAQAATGFLIDPVTNQKVSVEEAVKAGVVGPEMHDKLASAEKAVVGYNDPYTGQLLSLFQALKKELIVESHGIRLLEAQIATGGIIDPHHALRLPVEVAYQRGMFDKEMNKVLSDPCDDTKGFFDPNTQDNLTYFQLKERCVTDPETGLCLLIVTDKVVKGIDIKVEVNVKRVFHQTMVSVKFGRFSKREVTLWEIINSEYFTADQMGQLVGEYKSGKLTIESLVQKVTTIVEEMENKTKQVVFQGLRCGVSAQQLVKSKIIDEKVLQKLQKGTTSVLEVAQLDSVKQYLTGEKSIAGVFVEATKKKLSIYQAMKKRLLMPGTALILLEAQAATGFIIDPVRNVKLSVEEAVEAKVIGSELRQKLLSAERAVTGYNDPYTGNTISLFQAMKKDLIVKEHGIRLLEAQIATGGIIDPVNSHRIPIHVAFERDMFDEEMNQILEDPSDDTKGFFDPSTQENLTYLQLQKRCQTDTETGLSLLCLRDHSGMDKQTSIEFKQAMFSVTIGRFNGETISIWECLNSEYVSQSQRVELVLQYQSHSITLEQVITTLISYIGVRERNEGNQVTVDGLRKKITLQELLNSQLIGRETYEAVNKGSQTVQEILEKDSVKKYLQGTSSIAGILLQPSGEKMSIYQAIKKNHLMPGTALILLEAQAATGFIVDPVKNLKLSVDEALKAKVIGSELQQKLLSAERAVTGYKDPYTGNTISLFQAMKKDLIVYSHGIRLLEAQIATGGIIDPIASHRLPVHVAYERGMFDAEMNQVLEDTGDDTKGFFDPNTKENLTYLELKKRCVTDPHTGLYLLPLGSQKYLNDQSSAAFKTATVTLSCGKYKGKTLSVWELFHSEYLTEEHRMDMMQQLNTGKLSIESVITRITCIIEQTEKTEIKDTFMGLRADVTAKQLLESDIINKQVYEDLKCGTKTVTEISQMDLVKKYLEGTGSIAGVLIESSNQTMSIYEAKRQHHLMPGTALILLEAQAATGFIIDPVKNLKLSVDGAVKARIIGPEVHEKLLSAERAVTGYKDPYTGNTISLFQAIKKDLIVKEHGIRLLEAQIATGGIIDPVNSHRLPVHVAYKQGLFDEDMNRILEDSGDDTKGFFDPNTKENLTYLELKKRCVTVPVTGLCLLKLSNGTVKRPQANTITRTEEEFKKVTMSNLGGSFNGNCVSVWDILYSEYFSEVERKELIERYQTKEINMQTVMTTITTILQVTKSESKTSITVTGIKGQVPVEELVKCQIVDAQMQAALEKEALAVEDVVQHDSVKKCLQGESSIAGLLIHSTHEKLSIYQAMKKRLLRGGTALMLLEAQAATGFLIDPVTNQKVSVEEAVKAGVVGPEMHDKLASAEKAVVGYNDPYTGQLLSLFQALKKELIVESHGIRLLEAQIATGGIIDPHHALRLPVEVAYQRGMFDKEMNKVLSDPCDDTKGFFDPNTQDNLTYFQLKERCVTDPETGLCLLIVTDKVVKGIDIKVEVNVKRVFHQTMVSVKFGRFSKREVTLWEIINSEYFTADQMGQLVGEYKSGKLTIESLVQKVTTIVEEMENKTKQVVFQGLRCGVSAQQLVKSKIIDEKVLQKLQKGTTSVLEVAQLDSVKQYLTGEKSIAGVFVEATKKKLSIYQAMKKRLLMPGTALILLEAQAATGFIIDPVRNVKLSVEEAVEAKVIGSELRQKLLSAERAVTGYNDPYTGNTISLFQAMKKDLIVKEHGIRLLEAQIATGGIIDPVNSHRIPIHVAFERDMFDEEMNQILEDPSDDTKGFFDPSTQENLTYLQLQKRCQTDTETGLSLLCLRDHSGMDKQTSIEFKQAMFSVTIGRFNGETISIWECLNSEYVSQSQRVELVLQYQSHSITLEQVITTLISYIGVRERNEGNQVTVDGLRKKITLQELLNSQLIGRETYEAVNKGSQTVQEILEKDSVKKYLQGTSSIAGILLQPSGEKMSIYQAIKKNHLMPGTALILLEAQAATGFIVDPVKNLKLSVDEALKAKVIGSELQQKLLSAERAVTGYKDPYTGNTISLFQAMKKDLIVYSHGIRLLEAQIATGGIIDPIASHRLPVHVAYERGMFDAEMNQVLEDTGDDTKGFFDPNTKENLTYLELKKRCVTDPHTGLYLLPLGSQKYLNDQSSAAFKTATVTLSCGKYKGKTLSVWELFHSEYLTEEHRMDMMQQLNTGKLSIESVITRITCIIEQTEKTEIKDTFMGLRADVTAKQLLESDIINKQVYEDLKCGTKTVTEISQMDLVKKYLEGTGSIAGVLIESSNQTMSIYEAKRQHHLMPGTALILLEAQAATGFIIDPVKNLKLSVDGAVKARIIGPEVHEKLLSAERAVTGYKDPYTGNTISLFQAIKKDLIVKEHGIRLLEAQIATGGIIDPVNSHRLPVHVAYKQGLFDEDMNRILEDSGDDTKGFFDPNTKENLTYLELKKRCVNQPVTELWLLVLKK